MRALILGAGGFLGAQLAARVAADAHIGGRPLKELVLFDMRPVHAPAHAACKVTQLHGDLRDPALIDRLFEEPVHAIFHLAATLTVDAERDFRRGLETNVLGLLELLEHCRHQSTVPRLVFASSIATFGGKLPPVVGDDVFQAPTTSYGTHKAVAELLLADYSRHGFVDGRALRLPIVVTHPGPPTGSISDQVASLLREPLRGQKTICRLAPETRMVVACVDTVIDGFLRLAALPAETLGSARAMNLPGLAVTPGEIVAAVGRHQPGADLLVDWCPDPQLQRVIDGWPRIFTSARARALGLAPDGSADALVASFLHYERTSA